MTAVILKTLFRKKGTTSSILAIALLVAIIASMDSIVNYFNIQTEALVEFPNIGGTYLILNETHNSLAEDLIDANITDQLDTIQDIKYVIPQRILSSTMFTSLGSHTILVRGVEDVASFFKLKGGRVNGTTAKNETEANIGEILAKSIALNLEDEATLTFGNNHHNVVLVGIIKTLTQMDTEIIVPMETINSLTGETQKISLVEFALRDNVKAEGAINQITELLPRNVKLFEVQKPGEFLQDLNRQTLTFLDVWALAIYAVVVAASYVVATRLITESRYELAMIRALGAKKGLLFKLVLAYTATTALLGCILGLALGTAGTQTASTLLGWVWPSIEATPSLEAAQALQTLLLTFASAALGCLFPAFKSMHRSYREQPL